MGQPTQRATNYTARSNIDTAQIFLHANGQRPNRAMIRQRSRRRQRRGKPHTEHGLGVLLPALTALAQHISHSHSGIDEKRPTEKFVYIYIPIYPAISRYIPLYPIIYIYPAISRCIPLCPTMSHHIPPYSTISKTGYSQTSTPRGGCA